MNDTQFAELAASVREGRAILRGDAPPSRSFTFDAVDIKGLREQHSMSQAQFAALLGISVRTLRNWEQGRRRPDGAALVLLQVAARRPEAVWDAVQAVPSRPAPAAAREPAPAYTASQTAGHGAAVDFARSFLTFRIDTLKKQPLTVSHKPPFSLNNVRIQLDSVCTIVDKQSGQAQRFVLGANCKTERVGVARDIWTEPNADYVPIFSADRYLILKAWARAGMNVMLYPPSLGKQPERQIGLIADTYDSVRIDVVSCNGAVLSGAQEIVMATLANHPLNARTVIENARYSATIEYPIKTMNVNERDGVYQTDTGPILLPDLERAPDDLIAGMELAFIALNAPDWAEVLVRTPTPIADGISVHHYSRSLRLTTRNTIVALG